MERFVNKRHKIDTGEFAELMMFKITVERSLKAQKVRSQTFEHPDRLLFLSRTHVHCLEHSSAFPLSSKRSDTPNPDE